MGPNLPGTLALPALFLFCGLASSHAAEFHETRRLREQLESSDARSHPQALIGLSKIPDPAAMEALAGALSHSNPDTARRAGRYLIEAMDRPGGLDRTTRKTRESIARAIASSDAEVREYVVQAAGKVQPPMVELLKKLSADSNGRVSWQAREMLEKVNPPSPGELIEALDKSQPSAQVDIIGTLARHPTPEVAARLTRFLEDRQAEPALQTAAAAALARINTSDPGVIGRLLALLAALEQESTPRRPDLAADALAFTRDNRATEALANYRRERAAWQVRHASSELPRLLGVLKDGDWKQRQRAVEDLGRIGGDQAVAALVEALGSQNQMTSQRAKFVLEGMDPALTRKAMLDAAISPNAAVRTVAADALAKARPLDTELMLTLSRDPEANVRKRAAAALAACKESRCAVRLTELLGDEGPVRAEATDSLKAMGRAATEALLGALSLPSQLARSLAVDHLGRLEEPRAAAPLVGILEDQRASGMLRRSAVDALKRIKPKDPQLANRLISLLSDEKLSPFAAEALAALPPEERIASALAQYETRRAEWKSSERQAGLNHWRAILKGEIKGDGTEAIRSLAALRTPAAYETIATALDHSDGIVVRRAASVFSGDSGAAPPLEMMTPAVWNALAAAATNRDAAVRSHVAGALGRARPAMMEPLLKLASDPDDAVRCAAARALGDTGDARAAAKLVEMLSDQGRNVSDFAAGALTALGPAAGETLVRAFDGAGDDLQSKLTRQLGEIRDPRVADRLVRIMEDEKKPLALQYEAGSALKRAKSLNPALTARLIALLPQTDIREEPHRADRVASVLETIPDESAQQAVKAYQARRAVWEKVSAGNRRKEELKQASDILGSYLCKPCQVDADCVNPAATLTCQTFQAMNDRRQTRRLCAPPGAVSCQAPPIPRGR